jgi:hypothetical protein
MLSQPSFGCRKRPCSGFGSGGRLLKLGALSFVTGAPTMRLHLSLASACLLLLPWGLLFATHPAVAASPSPAGKATSGPCLARGKAAVACPAAKKPTGKSWKRVAAQG